MKQMMVRTQRIPNGDTLARYVLEARAGQAARVEGFKLDLTMGVSIDFKDSDESLFLSASLMAAPRTTSAVPVAGAGDLLLDGLNRTRALIGYLSELYELKGPTNASLSHSRAHVSTGWVPCGFDVPGLWIAASSSPVGTSRSGMVTLTLLFDWVTMTPIQVAALYTTYGIDSVDSTERQAVGEVDFSRAMGEGNLPPLVG